MNWTIKNRLIAGCVVLLVVIAIACAYGLQQMSSAEGSIKAIAKRGEVNMKRMEGAHDAKGELLDAKGNRAEFLLNKQTKSVEAIRQNLKDVRAALALVVDGAAANDPLNAPVKSALASADTYEKTINEMADLLTKRGLKPDQGLEGNMRKSVQAVEALVNEQGLAELSVLMLMCRRHEKDYLLRGDPKYLGEIAKRIEEFTAQMKQFSLPADAQTKATAAFKDYYANMQAIVEIDKSIKTIIADSDASAAEFDKTVDAVNSSLDAIITEDRKSSLDVMATGRFVMLVLLVVGLVLGVAVAVVLIRTISPPLEAAVRALQTFVEQTASAASQISNSSQTLAEGASEQAASLEETSASLEEMASMTKRNAEAAQNAKQVAGQARSVADSGTAGMQRMSAAMDGIKTSSGEIAKIIKTIDEIAFQTNILALNAAVEAARAGEAGAGFAVVAEEVRSLAQRSAQAAKETASKIEAALVKSEEGARASSEVSSILNEIVGQVRTMDTLVAEIANASSEQSQGIDQVNIAVSQMDKVTQGNAAAAEESAAAAEELTAQSTELQSLTHNLGNMVGVTKEEGGVKTAAVKPAAKRVGAAPAAKQLGAPKASPVRAKAAEPVAAGKAGDDFWK